MPLSAARKNAILIYVINCGSVFFNTENRFLLGVKLTGQKAAIRAQNFYDNFSNWKIYLRKTELHAQLQSSKVAKVRKSLQNAML